MRFAGVASVVLLAACSLPDSPQEDPDFRWAQLGLECSSGAPATTLPDAARDSLPAPAPDLNAQWADLARRAPGGWGGYFLDDGAPTMYLVDTSQLEAAASFLGSEGFAIDASVTARQGRWDFAQLFDWYRYLNRFLWAVDGVSFSDIQEARNRLEYGAIDEAVRSRMEQVLSGFEVPCFLVALRIQGYASLLE